MLTTSLSSKGQCLVNALTSQVRTGSNLSGLPGCSMAAPGHPANCRGPHLVGSCEMRVIESLQLAGLRNRLSTPRPRWRIAHFSKNRPHDDESYEWNQGYGYVDNCGTNSDAANP